MNYDELENIYKLQENANSTEQELLDAGFFEDYFSKKFEISILPREDAENENLFYLVVKIESKGARLSEEEAEEITDTVDEKFFDLISSVKSDEEVDELRNYYSGTQFYLNGDQLY